MSGLVKGVKKVFKKVVKVVKKVAKPLLIGAAIYFTAGLALSAIPATASFAAAMPGFAGAGGAGIFGKAAAATGAVSGGTGGAVAAALPSIAPSASSVAAGMTGGAAAGAGAAAPTLIGAGGAAGAGAGAGLLGKVAGAWKGMTLAEKMMLASYGTQALGALTAPTAADQAEDIAAAQAKWHGAFYGTDDQGNQGDVSGLGVLQPPGFANRDLFEMPGVSGRKKGDTLESPPAAPRDLFSSSMTPDAAYSPKLPLPGQTSKSMTQSLLAASQENDPTKLNIPRTRDLFG